MPPRRSSRWLTKKFCPLPALPLRTRPGAQKISDPLLPDGWSAPVPRIFFGKQPQYTRMRAHAHGHTTGVRALLRKILGDLQVRETVGGL